MEGWKKGSGDPRSRILDNPSSLKDWELLSVIFGSGVPGKDVYSLSRDLLLEIGGIPGILRFRPFHLSEMNGLGPVKRSQIIALSEISRRIAMDFSETSGDFFPFSQIFKSLRILTSDQVRENFYLVNFSLEGKVLRMDRISQGSLWEVGVYKRDIVKMILDDASRYTLIAHNHPRHTSTPSEADLLLYHELSRILEDLEVVLIDQWVLGDDGLHSCRYPNFLNPEGWTPGKLPKEYEFLADIHTTL